MPISVPAETPGNICASHGTINTDMTVCEQLGTALKEYQKALSLSSITTQTSMQVIQGFEDIARDVTMRITAKVELDKITKTQRTVTVTSHRDPFQILNPDGLAKRYDSKALFNAVVCNAHDIPPERSISHPLKLRPKPTLTI